MTYHQHIPRPDPMTNPDTVARAAFYDVQFVPVVIVDGTHRQPGGGKREDASTVYERIAPVIEEDLREPAGATIAVRATTDGNTVNVRVETGQLATSVNLRVLLVEDEIRYGGENGIRFHPMVARAGADTFMPSASDTRSVACEFSLDSISANLTSYLDSFERQNDRFGPITFSEKKSAVNAAALTVVAFVQDADSQRVLQSASAKVTRDR